MTAVERLSQGISRIQQERIAVLSQFQSLSQDQVDYKLSSASCSIGQIAHHMGLTEKLLQDNVRALLPNGGETREFTRRIGFDELPMGPQVIPHALLRLAPIWLPFAMMRRFMPRAMRTFILANPIIKVRTAPAVEPEAVIPHAQLIEYLRQLRDSTLKLLEPVKSWDLSRFRWTVMVWGPTTYIKPWSCWQVTTSGTASR